MSKYSKVKAVNLTAPVHFHFPVTGTAPPFNQASFTSTPGPDTGKPVQADPPGPRLHGRCKIKLCSERRGIPALVQSSRYARFCRH